MWCGTEAGTGRLPRGPYFLHRTALTLLPMPPRPSKYRRRGADELGHGQVLAGRGADRGHIRGQHQVCGRGAAPQDGQGNE